MQRCGVRWNLPRSNFAPWWPVLRMPGRTRSPSPIRRRLAVWTLQETKGSWRGRNDVVFTQLDANGKTLDTEQEAFDFDWINEIYERYLVKAPGVYQTPAAQAGLGDVADRFGQPSERRSRKHAGFLIRKCSLNKVRTSISI